jgi:trans-2,3-dihydro-3-hydroxyanthranilate isomerase
MPPKRSYRYRVVDVFTLVPLEGNPLAVFPDSNGLDEVTMQRIAREMNLSETVFIEPATLKECAASLRIFTPTREMVFAGHPTVGASYVLRLDGFVSKDSDEFSVQEKIGKIPIRITPGESPIIWLLTPPITFGDVYEPATCARALGLDVRDLLPVQPQIVSAGNACLFVAVAGKEQVDRCSVNGVEFNRLKPEGNGHLCLFVFAPTDEGAYSRMFAPEFGIIEDPATGSATGPLAAFMMRNNLLPKSGDGPFVSEQGTKMGRRSLLYFEVSPADANAAIPVGGHVTPIAEGTLTL